MLDKKKLPFKEALALCFVTSMALVCRPTNAFLLPFLLYFGYKLIRRGMLSELVKRAPLFLICLFPIALQMAIWRQTTGDPIYYSYGDEGFAWARPALWQTLFSSRNGLFIWAPILSLSMTGVFQRIKKDRLSKDPLLLFYILAFFVLWYLNSAWHGYWWGHAFGNRGFLELQGLFIFGLAFYLQSMRHCSAFIKGMTQIFIALCVVYLYVLMILYIGGVIPRGGHLF